VSQVIKPKRSYTASSVPTVSDLAEGEIAINTADRKIYVRDDVNDIHPIGGIQNPVTEDIDVDGNELDMKGGDFTDSTGAIHMETPYQNGVQYFGSAFGGGGNPPIYTTPNPKLSTWSYNPGNQLAVFEYTTANDKVMMFLKAIETNFTTAGAFVTSTTYTIVSTGTTDFTLIGAADSNVGTEFTATGPGTGDGVATNYDTGEHNINLQLIGNEVTIHAMNPGGVFVGLDISALSIHLAANGTQVIKITDEYAEFKKPPLLPHYTTTERDALSTIDVGMMIYNTTDSKIQAFVDGAPDEWVDLH